LRLTLALPWSSRVIGAFRPGVAGLVAPSFDFGQEVSNADQAGGPEERAVALWDLAETEPPDVRQNLVPGGDVGVVPQLRRLVADVHEKGDRLVIGGVADISGLPDDGPLNVALLPQLAQRALLRRLVGFLSASGQTPPLLAAMTVLHHEHSAATMHD
jgi:hypothetical protein